MFAGHGDVRGRPRVERPEERVTTATPEPVAAPVRFAPGQTVTRVDGRVGIVLGHDGGEVLARWSDDRPVQVTSRQWRLRRRGVRTLGTLVRPPALETVDACRGTLCRSGGRWTSGRGVERLGVLEFVTVAGDGHPLPSEEFRMRRKVPAIFCATVAIGLAAGAGA